MTEQEIAHYMQLGLRADLADKTEEVLRAMHELEKAINMGGERGATTSARIGATLNTVRSSIDNFEAAIIAREEHMFTKKGAPA